MSGIVGMLALDNAPVDRDLLHKMTARMAYRGPDGQHSWADGAVGFGHALLRVTPEQAHEQQPRTLDGDVWITADVRLDAWPDLIRKLEAQGLRLPKHLSDTDLLLHAYQAWGTACLDHLLGDFAFAIWDARQQLLFCARDHFGVKPFYYARQHKRLLFSNTLYCLRSHPAISDTLNDQAVADFLLFEHNRAFDTTMFADIQRLPPAHRLICRQKTVRVERYWTLPADHRPIRYKDRRDYTERFKEILCLAVKDRIRSPRLGLALSGGMDSATLAAMVHTVRKTDRPDLQVQAYTLVFDAIVPDEERFYAGLVGERLDLPVHFIAGDDDNLYEGWHEPAFQRPEPLHHPRLRTNIRLYERIVADGIRTTMWGLGLPDYFLTPRAYFLQLLKRLRLFRLARDVSTYALLFRQLPRIGFRGKIKKMLGLLPPSCFWLPEWINPDFERQLNLKARWERLGDYKKLVEAEHPLHPELYKGLLSPIWPAWFEIKDPGSIFFPIEMHYPYMDLRLLNYVLAVPPVPWAKDKHLFRVAMEGILPDAVCHRPKTTLVGNALHVLLQREASAWIDHFDPDPRLSRYIDREKIPRLTENQLSHQNFANERHYKLNLHLNLRPLTLNLWLRSLEATKNPTDQAWA